MKKLAVLGHPVAHSRSPAIHNAAFTELGLADQWSYEAIDIPPERLEAEFARLAGGGGWVGANVTIPHKQRALALADEAGPAAAEIGAANTLSFSAGRIRADNTDAEGLIASLPGPVAGESAIVLGAGGAARAAVWALRREGAEVAVWNRTPERAELLTGALGGGVLRLRPGEALAAVGLLVNATSVGLVDGGGQDRSSSVVAELKALGLRADELHDRLVVVDLVYGPTETGLVEAAKAAGARTVDGLEILVRQGAASFEIWTGLEAPLATMRRAALAHHHDRPSS
jgi:shikimate dehydrogenase